jgi:hypothetical protein
LPSAMRGAAGHGDRSVPGGARKSVDGLTDWRPKIIVRETSLRMRCPSGCVCGISDIVKRRSIRVWGREAIRAFQSLSPDHFGARSSQDEQVVNDPVSEA